MTRLTRADVFKNHIKEMFVDKRPNISEERWEKFWAFLNIAFSEYAFRSASTYYRCLYTGVAITSEWGRNGKKNYEMIMRTVLRHRWGENISALDLGQTPVHEGIAECPEE